jgi:hypothetical protein
MRAACRRRLLNVGVSRVAAVLASGGNGSSE